MANIDRRLVIGQRFLGEEVDYTSEVSARLSELSRDEVEQVVRLGEYVDHGKTYESHVEAAKQDWDEVTRMNLKLANTGSSSRLGLEETTRPRLSPFAGQSYDMPVNDHRSVMSLNDESFEHLIRSKNSGRFHLSSGDEVGLVICKKDEIKY